jgi:5-methylcytosine-specific restriction endonuclease McrA
MSRKYLRKALRQLVSTRAKQRCEYFQTQAEPTAMPMEVDHIIPLALQGLTEENNLCLACSYCNDAKNDRIAGLDPESGEYVALFNPRTQRWKEHFEWSVNGEYLIGLTPTGRATILSLNLNRPELVRGRRVWVKAGSHPPAD